MTAITVTNPDSSARGKKVTLSDQKIEQFKKMEHVTVVTPILNVGESVQISAGQFTYSGEVIAMDTSSLKAFGYKLTEGSFVKKADPVGIYFGAQAPWAFRDTNLSLQPEYRTDEKGEYIDPPPLNVMSSQITIAAVKNETSTTNGSSTTGTSNTSATDTLVATAPPKKSTGAAVNLNCLGMMKSDYAREGASYGAIVSLETGQRLKNEYNMLNGITDGNTKYDTVKIKVDSYESVEKVEEAIKAEGFTTSSAREFREAMGKTAKMIQMILGGLGAISLFVAALGITNTMIMSIYERTREIGVMKVLGCPLNDIRMMFLTEAGAIGFMGGVVGIILSYIISFGVNSIAGSLMPNAMGGKISVIPFWLIFLGLGFAVGVGLVSGFSPANRAVKISPLSAIRQD